VETTVPDQPSSPINVIEILRDRDLPLQQQQDNALSHSERTQRWLMAQRAYLKGVPDVKDKDQIDAEIVAAATSVPKVEEKKPKVPPKNDTLEVEPKKKTVRFSEAVISTKVPKQLPSKLSRTESAYWRAFADLTVRTQASDAFVHRLPRFEALQAQRISLREAHRNQLLGKHQLSVLPQSAKKRMSANVVRGDDQLIDDPEKLRADKEAEALDQMRMATWHVAATKLLNGGKLITSPVIKRLNRQSRMLTTANGLSRDRARILDLGSTAGPGDWAWHVSLAYPNTKIYTVTTHAARQLSNCNVRGPPNHRQIAVEKLTHLPFSDNQFDLISARDLQSMLKIFGENGEDEWEACMAECLRVLKPGGYLEFSLLDADIINPGPLGLARSVELGFTLQTLGYDASPSKLFVNRLYRAGFEDLKRSWMCLPLGPKPGPPLPPMSRDSKTQSPMVEGRVCQMEAMVTGSADNLAAVSGFVAGWSWEKWILRTEMEKIAGE
jgi:SAM-dependent methyltransferase